MAALTSIENISLPEALRRAAAKWAQAPAIVTEDDTLSFATLAAQSDALAAALIARGVRPGDRICLYAPNSPAFVISYCGIVKAGAVVVPLNPMLHPEEAAWIVGDSGAAAMIFSDQLEAARAILDAAPRIKLRIRINSSRKTDNDDLPWERLIHPGTQPPLPAIDPARDPAVILYTSGTTGRPKGAVLTHRNLVANAASVKAALHLEPGGHDRILVVLPMFHAFAAMAGMIFPLLHGCCLAPLPRFSPDNVARTIDRLKITVLPAVPSMFNLLLRLPRDLDHCFRSLRYCISGGAALPRKIMESFEERFKVPIYEGDGPTECSPVTCVNPIGGLRKPGSVGLPVPGVEMNIMDAHGNPLPPETIGEITVRGPNVMKEYWQRPAETQAAFFGDWFRTGDLGYRDNDGYFYIVDRCKDMIICNGVNVYPRIIEEVLYRCPGIREAAVVGEPHPLHGEIPVAYVSLQPHAVPNASEIRDFCRRHLGRHEIPRRIHFMDELPKNASGKIMKRALSRRGEIERGVNIISAEHENREA